MRRIIKRNNKIVCNIRDEINLNKFLEILKEWFVETDWRKIEVIRIEDKPEQTIRKAENILKESSDVKTK